MEQVCPDVFSVERKIKTPGFESLSEIQPGIDLRNGHLEANIVKAIGQIY